MHSLLRRVLCARAWSGVVCALWLCIAPVAHGQVPAPSTDRDYYDDGAPGAAKVELGRMLFFDKLLSGNGNISCATCHHAQTGTGDGLSLPVGEGGDGLGPARNTGRGANAVAERVPRNAPALFNLGAREFRVMFHDGRVAVDPGQPGGFLSPAGPLLPAGLDNVLAVQAMFPVTSATEMAGQPGENPIAELAAAGDLVGIWDALAARLRDNPEYASMFEVVYDIDRERITYVHAANALAAYEAVTWRADQSPFDRYLGGARNALSGDAEAGRALFYGRAGCADCHSGTFQTDHAFHSIAMPQIGPGKGDGNSGQEDFGRERVSGRVDDRYRFRTPSLRNVALTGPWGHTGAFSTLESVVRHHGDAVASLNAYDPADARLPPRADLDAIDFVVQQDEALRAAIAASNELPTFRPNNAQVRRLLAFLSALTDPSRVDLREDVPERVPSGLPVFESADSTCFARYGSTPRFVQCEQTPGTCEFLAETEGSSCRQVCEEKGGACIDAFNDADDADRCGRGNDWTCETSGKFDQICLCTNPPLSCSERYGSLPGFMPCEDKPGFCEFYVKTRDESCDDVCAAKGGACVRAHADESNTCVRQESVPCSEPAFDQLCTCTLP